MALREVDGGPGYFSQFANSLPSDPSFFPIGVWYESVTSQADINLDKAAGLNLYVVLTGDSNLSLIQNNGMYAILQADTNTWRTNQAAINNPAVVGWVLGDEIDMTQGPGQGYTTLNNILGTLPNDGRFHYSNYGKGVMFWETDAQAEQFVNDFQQVTSVDTYWFTDPNIDGGSEGGTLLNNGNPLTVAQTRLAANYGYTVDRMRELDAMDGQRQPIWAFVEVGWPFTETAAQGGRAIEPEEIKAAVWHSIIAGARGIIYFNHSFGGPDQTQHALRDPAYAAERAAVTETDALIDQLAPVLNAPFDDGFVTVGPSVRVMAKFYDGVHYVFAGSTQNAASAATFTLAGVTSGTATVIDEGRAISITNGQFVDNFANGNAIHIYQISTSVGAVLAGSISINDVTISEGNSGTKVATFTVTRSGGTAAFDVNYATSDGTATVADGDYVAASNTLHFGANQNTQTISVTINGDTKVEANETFNIALSNATNGATISDSQGVGTITNDDGAALAGSVSINDVTISEGNSGTKVATFTVTRSGGTAAFDVNYASSNGTATVADSDYVAASGTLNFGVNQNTQTISVTINGDTKVEGNETFNVDLSNATNGATITDSQGVGTISNDDSAATPNLVVNGGFESGNFSGWTLSGNYGGNQIYIAPITFPGEVHTGSYSAGFGSMNRTDGILTQNIGTTAGQHYTLSFWIESDNDGLTPVNHFAAEWNGQTLMAVTDAPNSGYQLYTFDVVGINGNSVLEFDAYNSPDAWRLDDITLTAVGVAVPAAPTVSINDVAISEGDSGTKLATFTATRSGGTAAFDVNYATSDGTATVADSDYVAASNTLHFGDNENTKTISVTINGDTKVEGNETFNVVLSNATNGATISDGQGVGTISNDDSAATSGQAAIWTMNGMNLTGAGTVGPNPGPSWHVKDAADFTGDGKADILWQNDSGQAVIWTMNGMNLTGEGFVGANPGPSWHVKDAADFNGDGKADILWQNDSGQAAIWTMNGMNLTGEGFVGANPGPSWHVKDAADFTGDGKADILWQNDSGQAVIWTMNGMNLTGEGFVGANPGPSWHVKDAADFNGDGKADILWQNDSGQAAIWTMNGMNLTGAGTVGANPGPSWHVKDAADFTGDGKADILWQNDSGQAVIWTMNGMNLTGEGFVGANPGPSWHVKDAADFNGDSQADILWQWEIIA